MSEKKIIIHIDLDTGEQTIEAFGYPGRTCKRDIDAVLKAIGGEKSGEQVFKNETVSTTKTVKTQR